MEKDYKGKMNEKLMAYYTANGKENAILLADKMLEATTHKKDKIFRAHVHGEICETVLEICILDFMSRHKEETGDWFYSKGMILKDKDNPNSPYLTEIDMTLFTPYKILTVECKSYGGDKVFTKKCTVNRVGVKSTDVYEQHEKHYKTLLKTFEPFRKNGNGSFNVASIQIGYFNFSIGKVEDKRTDKWQNTMPILNVQKIEALLKTYLNKPIYWKMDYVKRAVSIVDANKKKNTTAHLKYVTDLHRK